MAPQSIGAEEGGAEACSAHADQQVSLFERELWLPAETNTRKTAVTPSLTQFGWQNETKLKSNTIITNFYATLTSPQSMFKAHAWPLNVVPSKLNRQKKASSLPHKLPKFV